MTPTQLHELTPEEARWIKRFKRVCKAAPKSLWIFAGNGFTVSILRKKNGKKVENPPPSLGFDQDYIVAEAKIENDGGQW